MAGWVQMNSGRSLWKDDQGNLYEDEPAAKLDTSRELTGLERAKYALAADKPEVQAEALKRMGYGATLEGGKVYAVKDGVKFQPDRSDLTFSDVIDVGALVPEMAGAGFGATIGGIGGTVTTGGAGAVPGAIAGAGMGGAAGTRARQKLAQWAGVEDPNRKGQIGEIVESGVLNAAIPVISSQLAPVAKKAAGAAKSFAGATADAVIGVSRGRTAQLAGPQGRQIAKSAANISALADEMAPKAREVADGVKSAVFSRYRENIAGAVPLEAPVDVSPLRAAYDMALQKAKVIDETGAIRTLREIKSESDVKELVDYRGLLDSVQTIDDAVTLRRNIDDAIDWKKSEIGTRAQGILKELRANVEKYIENAAEAAGTGQQYKAAKQTYASDVAAHSKIAKAFSDDKVLSSLRNIDNDSKIQLRKSLEKAKEIAPELSETIDELSGFAAASEWTKFIPPIDVGRGLSGIAAGSVAAGAVDPIVGGIGYVATRPAVARNYIPAIGAASRAVEGAVSPMMPAVASATRPLAREAAVEASRNYMTPIVTPREAKADLGEIGAARKPANREDISATLNANMPNLVPFVKNTYGANFDRAIKAGQSELEATQSILQSIAGREKFGAGFGKLLGQLARELSEQTGTSVSASDVKWALQGAQ